MQQGITHRWREFRDSGRQSLQVLGRWRRHEWHSLQGHVYALLERVQVAQTAPSLEQLIHDQLDLLPESRQRLRRNAELRRALWRELRMVLLVMLRGRG